MTSKQKQKYIFHNQTRNQEFLRAGEVSENKGTSINIFNLQHTSAGKNFGYFFLDTLKTAF